MQLGVEGMSPGRSQAEGAQEKQLKLMSLDEVAVMLGVSRAWVRDHATRRNPRIPVVRLGGKRAILRFRPADLETFIERHLISNQKGGVA
jgi:predicted DNA-binding transcriptional regulator AlpA